MKHPSFSSPSFSSPSFSNPSFNNPWSALSLGKIVVCLALLYYTPPGQAQEMALHGSWGLRLLDPQTQLQAVATLQFSNEPARTCMRGKWKRVVVETNDPSNGSNASNPTNGSNARNASNASNATAFFPLDEALAYKVERGVLTMGRVANCHRYLLLSATVSPTDIHGTYKAVSVGRSKQLGLFTLRPKS